MRFTFIPAPNRALYVNIYHKIAQLQSSVKTLIYEEDRMRLSRRSALTTAASLGLISSFVQPAFALNVFDVRKHGARGDGATLDTAAIQKAIDAAGAAGGTIYFPPGRYLSFTLRLRSHITILFDSGATLIAADPALHHGQYDMPEANQWDQHQDYGHNYWHNSLMWGDGLEDITVAGPGLIDGAGLTRESPTAPWTVGIGRHLPQSAELDAKIAAFHAEVAGMRGKGNKILALKNCRNIIVRDVSMLRAGHFGLLLTGVDNITLDNLKIDTQRDGMDLDVVRNARVSNCTVNSPYDDGIVLKSSNALGVARPTENVSITNCQVTGYDVGSLLDGTYKKSQLNPPIKHRTSGRIKLGTETNGGFRNIAVSNCVFDCCNGLAIESVDGGVLEDVVVSNLTMRDATGAPLFIRLGDRRRAPDGTPIAALKRVHISDIACDSIDPRGMTSTITGVPGASVEDVTVRGMRWTYQGGGTAEMASRAVPEMVESYPDPDVFGPLPAWGLYARHVKGLRLGDIELETLKPDARKPVVMEDVSGLHADGIVAKTGAGTFEPVKL
jgi:polygalacturonase